MYGIKFLKNYCNRGERSNSILLKQKVGEILSSGVAGGKVLEGVMGRGWLGIASVN